MRLYEFINEDVSKTSSLKHIIDVLTVQLPPLYSKLTTMAENMYYNKGSLTGFNFIAGGQTANWFNTVFFDNMKPSLYNFAKHLPLKLAEQLRSVAGTSSFAGVEGVIHVLDKIAKETRNTELHRATNTALSSIDKYQRDCRSIAAGDLEDEVAPVKAPKDTTASSQNVAADSVVNDVLSRIDKNQAGEIRNAIAKSSNKLQALMAELTKRGIEV